MPPPCDIGLVGQRLVSIYHISAYPQVDCGWKVGTGGGPTGIWELRVGDLGLEQG